MNQLVFDVDGTLYDNKPMYPRFFELLTRYLQKKLNISEEKALAEVEQARKNTQISMTADLIRKFGLSHEEFFAATLGKLDVEKHVATDEKLQETLKRLGEQNQVSLWTNSTEFFARRVVAALGIQDLFVDLFVRESVLPYAKPEKEAFQKIEQALPPDRHITLIDDSLRNIRAAHEFGWETIWCTEEPNPSTQFSGRAVRTVHELS